MRRGEVVVISDCLVRIALHKDKKSPVWWGTYLNTNALHFNFERNDVNCTPSKVIYNSQSNGITIPTDTLLDSLFNKTMKMDVQSKIRNVSNETTITYSLS